MKTIGEWKKIARLLKQVYIELEKEALEKGIDLLSKEYGELIDKTRLLVLEKNDWTLEEYRQIKEQLEGIDKAGTLEIIREAQRKVEETYNTIEELKNRHIPTKEEIESIARGIAKQYIKPPEIINKIVKEVVVEKPRIVETTKIRKEKYDDSKLKKEIDELEKSVRDIKIPTYDFDKLRKELRDDFNFDIQENIEIFGMKDFRKLGMGLQAQIDTKIEGVGLSRIFASATEPANAVNGDFWFDIS